MTCHLLKGYSFPYLCRFVPMSNHLAANNSIKCWFQNNILPDIYFMPQFLLCFCIYRVGNMRIFASCRQRLDCHVTSCYHWDIRASFYVFYSQMSFLKACVRWVSDSGNLSESLVSEGEVFCLLNPSHKTYVTQAFIDVFILSFPICIFMFGLSSRFNALELCSMLF